MIRPILYILGLAVLLWSSFKMVSEIADYLKKKNDR